jgi:uncharacterized membrane protein YphA (DoxX/SURF4 family)
MKLSIRAKTVPGRVVTGAYILRSGLEKWKGDEERAARAHGPAAEAFPVLKLVPPRRFLRLLGAAEIATGTALLTPFVPAAAAGAALTGFSGGVLALVLLSGPPAHEATSRGIGIGQDLWMVGIGLGLMAEGAIGG